MKNGMSDEAIKYLLLIKIIYLVIPGEAFNPCGEQFEIVTDFNHEDCKEGFFYQQNGNEVFNCFPKCEKKPDISVPCNPNPCPPGYYCPESQDPNKDTYCKIDEDSCFKYHIENPNINPWKFAWKPDCLPDGTWAPKQCKGEATNGRCFCYDAKGNRIFGQEFIQNAVNMTCACSRKRVELMNSKSQFYTTLHCDSMGNFEPLQCDSGQCWCVEHATGEITEKVVPESMLHLLPCYSKEKIGEQYMRKCESEEYAQKNIEHEFNIHGTDFVTFSHLSCDADGSYGPYQIRNGIATCTWKDNTNILSYAAPLDHNINNLNCHCARDIKIYETVGLKQNLKCLSNGNYDPQQVLNTGKWYCVDQDGFKSSDYFDQITSCTKYT